MSAGSLELMAPLGASLDCVAYRARSPDGAMVEVRTLSGVASDPVRWPRLMRRLRQAQLLHHPSARRVVDLQLESEPPTVTLSWSDASALVAQVAFAPQEAVALGLDLAGVLREAHRLGLAHGGLSPQAVKRRTSSEVEVDFSGTSPDESLVLSGTSLGRISEDVAGLAALIGWMINGRTPRQSGELASDLPGPIRALLSDMLARPENRPPVAEVERRLREILGLFRQEANLDNTRLASQTESTPARDNLPLLPGTNLGRFHLIDRIGSGGMGEVFRAEDIADGQTVAIKTILPEHSRNADVLRRFLKEARLLAEVHSPYVAQMIDVNEDRGIHYLAVEFIAGPPLSQLTDDERPVPERLALRIVADVCRALASVHEVGILHRDIKPGNIMLTFDPATANPLRLDLLPPGPLAKLTDFGLARHRDQSESMHLTRTGAVVGTPLYLSPEQCTGDELDARSDVYGLGATLFHLLAGRPPFLGDSALVLINHHCNTPVPSLGTLVPSVSEGASRIVEKALAKSREYRYPDATAMLRDITDHLDGKPSNVEAHPRLPPCDPARVLSYDFKWELSASPAELWPFVSNTERLNRAIALPAIDWKVAPDERGRVRRRGELRKFGIVAAWEEHPFEWVEGRRFGVLRECTSGPFRWLLSLVEMTPRPGGGTLLTHQLRVEPTGLLGRAVAAVEMGNKTRRNLDRVYRRIDAVLTSSSGVAALVDPYEEPARLTRSQRRRLDEGLDDLARRGVAPQLVEQLGAYLATGPAQELGRIRPISLARRLGLDPDAVSAACLHGVGAGLLSMYWDLLCPLCRIPSQLVDTLKAVRDHAHCGACAVDFAVDFSQSVELVFRVHPSARDADVGVYCVGGPAHSPHVVAQVRVGPMEQLELPLELAAGGYRLRSPQLPLSADLVVERGVHPMRWDVNLGRMPQEKTTLRPGAGVLVLTNPHEQELVVRLERAAQRDDALTAARAASLALFRELFPGEVLMPGQLVSVSTVTLLATRLSALDRLVRQSGEESAEAQAFGLLHDHLRDLDGLARKHGGTLLKAIEEGGIAAFHHPAEAVRAALDLSPPAEAGLSLALHRGPALAATVNDRLDYFGGTVRRLFDLLVAAAQGEYLVGQSVLDDPEVSVMLRQHAPEAPLRRVGAAHALIVRQ